MSQSFWESEPVAEVQPEEQRAESLAELSESVELFDSENQQPEMPGFASEAEAEAAIEFVPEPQPEAEEVVAAEPALQPQPEPEPASQPVAKPVLIGTEVLAMTVDEFTALEDRVLRAVNLVKRERLTRQAIEENVAQLEAQLAEQRPLIDQLQAEVHSLRSERDQVRQRVERLLTQLDALEL